MMNSKPTQAVAACFTDLRRVQLSGSAVGERSAYGALTDLLNAVDDTLRPKPESTEGKLGTAVG